VLGILHVFSGISLPVAVTLIFSAKLFQLDSFYAILVISMIGGTGFLTYSISTIIYFNDCKRRNLSNKDSEFWRSVLIRCFPFLIGVPAYYWAVIEASSYDVSFVTASQIARKKGDIVYYLFKMEIYCFSILFGLSAAFAGLSVIFVQLIDIPYIFFTLAVYTIIPFLPICYAFLLSMLSEFVKESRDVQELAYFFNLRRGFLGAFDYYKITRRGKFGLQDR